jgi:predicted DNA-binding ribbon-helix-helix protein
MKPRQRLLSANFKRSIKLDGRKTSASLEDGFWNALKEIAAARTIPLNQLVLKIGRAPKGRNLSPSVRLFVLDYYRRK